MKDNLSIDAQTIHLTLAAVLLPLLAFIINSFLPSKQGKGAGIISSIAILISTVLSVSVFAKVWNTHLIHQQVLWFTIGQTNIYAGILLNNLSVLMLLLVNLIALPVHVYSMAYMKNDAKYCRYFTYLSFFCFSMLALVVVDNLVLFYVFWELVGFSSYLLIGFWFKKDKAVQANKKAFIMNRIGDIGLLTAIIVFFTQYHSFDIAQLFLSNTLMQPISNAPIIWQYVAFTGIFLAVAAKSAQFPLHTWLPDAMEGPTSVSALIHAATMVAAGVFLLGRVYPMFNQTELTILAVVGCLTAFMAATIALTQNDVKRILAYSTISQLGFMVMAMGIGAYASSLFHLVTHAFFKCLLFLVAGIVIHQMQHIKEDNNLDFDPQDINCMGGLRKKLPLTFVAALMAGFALIGLPFTSGFLSKDSILIQTFEWSAARGGFYFLLPVLAVITTWLTAFYVTRLIVKVFFGDAKLLQTKPDLQIHISDGGWSYKMPLVFLAICCLFPLFSLNPFVYKDAWVIKGLLAVTEKESIYRQIVPAIVTLGSLLVIYGAYVIYGMRKEAVFPQSSFFYRLSFNQWYFDKIYDVTIVNTTMVLSRSLFWFDRNVIDGLVNLLAKISIIISKVCAWLDHYIIDGFLNLIVAMVEAIGNFVRKFQGGKVQYYLFSMLVIILAVFIFIFLDIKF